ncbi:Sugar kinase of the NBD/HSP70 family, may contain an N-terminal HTH domain [Lentibacillus halodurans]|uniref:Sugar kinase of the NBD/HSP70 family, may contain an N-terminal HTH domain n=1 Tax=Lentibacillus halodurans TaxID=237679 RepID=A0A1I0VJE5_9BACI|nr:ROK family protein [Lentibacillus halodurans]SFA76040.1 Sugar kinase of the NBD/HSP70 family, may contain an N-terminal HTH domain [Lentibacillus halodurans]
MGKKRVHLDNYKKENKQKVFNAILEAGKISRTNIAKQTSLSSASVTLIVDELINEKYIKEIGTSASTGGRSQKLLGVDRAMGRIISFLINDYYIFAGSVTASLEVENVVIRNIKHLPTEDILNVIVEVFNQFKKNSDIYSASIGVKSPEFFKNTRVSISTSVSADFITVDEALRFMLGVPVIIERGVNFAALGEAHNSIQKKNIYFLDLDGEIQLGGVPSLPVEHVAHMKVGDEGKICSCGKVGCLNTFVSSEKIIENLKSELKEPNLTWHLISEAYPDGSSNVSEAIHKVSHYLGKGIVNISTLLRPSLFILGGDISKLDKIFEEKVEQSVRNFGYYDLNDLEVRLSRTGKNAFFVGGAKMFLLNVFKL